MKFTRRTLSGLLCGLAWTLTGFAGANTTLSIIKTTRLTGSDATQFIQTFTEDFPGNARFNFDCEKDTQECSISATTAGFSGKLAEDLLHGRSSAIFTSKNQKFKLECGRTSVYFCNVIQKDAVLP